MHMNAIPDAFMSCHTSGQNVDSMEYMRSESPSPVSLPKVLITYYYIITTLGRVALQLQPSHSDTPFKISTPLMILMILIPKYHRDLLMVCDVISTVTIYDNTPHSNRHYSCYPKVLQRSPSCSSSNSPRSSTQHIA